MDFELVFALVLLSIGSLAYIFWPQGRVAAPVEKTRLDYLKERKDVVYENLRDLNFEFRAGKYPEDDYARQRESLEAEAAQVVLEMQALGGS
jgi:cbb3-type cytochrome oxidase subunit 3